MFGTADRSLDGEWLINGLVVKFPIVDGTILGVLHVS